MASTTATVTSTHQPITAQNVLTLFPEIDTSLANTHRPGNTSQQDDALSGYDEEQIRLMDEVCIVLDENDNPIGSASKKTCHLMQNIDAGLLHRAFSVFLFSPRQSYRLLLQQRASEKITFPDLWTNTCCSHPLGIPGETGADLPASIAGVKRAAQRKLNQELGIRPEQVPLEDFHFLTRIHYKAASDGKWGEHEIDYILFIEADVDLDVNKNEARDTKYVDAEELRAMIKTDEEAISGGKSYFTPWFRLICHTMLFKWWEGLMDKENGGVKQFQSEEGIRRML